MHIKFVLLQKSPQYNSKSHTSGIRDMQFNIK